MGKMPASYFMVERDSKGRFCKKANRPQKLGTKLKMFSKKLISLVIKK